jgi:hypothetical protein
MIEKGPISDENSNENSSEKEEYQKIQETIKTHWLGLAEIRRRYKEGGEPLFDEWVEAAVQEWFKFQNENREFAEKVLNESFDIFDAQPLVFGKKEKDQEEKRIAARLRKDTLFREAVEDTFMNQRFFTAFGSDEFFVQSISLEELKQMEKLIRTRPKLEQQYKKEFIESLTNGTRLLIKRIEEIKEKSKNKSQSQEIVREDKKYAAMLEEKLAVLKEHFPRSYEAGEEKYKAEDKLHSLFVKRSVQELSETEADELLRLGEQYPDLFDEAVHANSFYEQFARGAMIHSNIEGAVGKAVTEINRHPQEMMQKFLSGAMNPAEAFNFFETIRLGENQIRSQELIEEFEAYLASEGFDKKEKQKYGIISGRDLPERVLRWFMKAYLGKPYEGGSFDFEEEESD